MTLLEWGDMHRGRPAVHVHDGREKRRERQGMHAASVQTGTTITGSMNEMCILKRMCAKHVRDASALVKGERWQLGLQPGCSAALGGIAKGD